MCESEVFNSKFVRDVSLKFIFVLPLSDFDIDQYWPHSLVGNGFSLFHFIEEIISN